MRNLITIFLLISQLVFSQNSDSNLVTKKTEKIAEAIAKDGMYKSAGIGVAGTKPVQWNNFEKLKEVATNKELYILSNHSSSAVRCYSFQALAERKDPNTFKVLLEHLKDNQPIETFQGCILGSESVGDFFLDVVTPKYISLKAYKLTEKERSKVDSILIFDPDIELAAKSDRLQKIKPEPQYYQRIKTIYLSDNNPSALIALSKYQKDEDKELIISWLKNTDTKDQYYGLRAVRHFPDTSFFPYLNEIQQKEIKKPTGFNYSLIRMLYLTTVQYKDLKSKVLIQNTLSNAKNSTLKYHSEYIWLALTKYPDPIYSGIKESLNIPDWKKKEFEYLLNEPDR